MGRTRKDVIADLNIALLAAGHSMRSASLAIGLNHSYLSRFMKETDYSPDVLPENVRLALATLLDIDETILRVGTDTYVSIKASEGIKPYGKRVGAESDRRTTEMRVDDVLQEIGRIKERLDRLESQPAAHPGSDKKSRPS